MKVPDPKAVTEIKRLSKDTRGEVIHTTFNGLHSIRMQLELDLQNQLSAKEILEHVDKIVDEWFRGEFKSLGFIGG